MLNKLIDKTFSPALQQFDISLYISLVLKVVLSISETQVVRLSDHHAAESPSAMKGRSHSVQTSS